MIAERGQAEIEPAAPPAEVGRALSRPAAFAQLAKLRISALVLITTAVGYLVALEGAVDPVRLGVALLGTALAAAGANALNQVLERELDARMARTMGRPLPTGRLRTAEAALFGFAVVALGTALLVTWVNALTAALAVGTVVVYAFVYTPLKRRTPLCTIVGAIPGATPPVMGVTAATGALDANALWLFLVLFAWQMPHFYAIAWIYRDDYRKGGFPMLTVVDTRGVRTTVESIGFVLLTIGASLAPALVGDAGPLYLASAIALGAAYAGTVVQFCRRPARVTARRVFLTSIVYLPLLLGMMVIDWA